MTAPMGQDPEAVRARMVDRVVRLCRHVVDQAAEFGEPLGHTLDELDEALGALGPVQFKRWGRADMATVANTMAPPEGREPWVRHKVPGPDGMLPCCNRLVDDMPRDEGLTADDELVTCFWPKLRTMAPDSCIASALATPVNRPDPTRVTDDLGGPVPQPGVPKMVLVEPEYPPIGNTVTAVLLLAVVLVALAVAAYAKGWL